MLQTTNSFKVKEPQFHLIHNYDVIFNDILIKQKDDVENVSILSYNFFNVNSWHLGLR